MLIDEWARKWGVPPEALEELQTLDADVIPQATAKQGSEIGVQQRAMIRASELGGRAWRNNVGVLMNSKGVPVRYGLCNTSARLNKNFKSSDLIGIRPVTVTPQMVGAVIGQFTAYECKAPGWSYAGSEREEAQLRFIDFIKQKGGYARFVTDPEQVI